MEACACDRTPQTSTSDNNALIKTFLITLLYCLLTNQLTFDISFVMIIFQFDLCREEPVIQHAVASMLNKLSQEVKENTAVIKMRQAIIKSVR